MAAGVDGRSNPAMTWRRDRSEIGENRFGLADFEAPGLFDRQMCDFAVLGNQRVTLAAGPHATSHQIQFKPDSLGEGSRSVGQHSHLAVAALFLAPGAHHEGVVHGDTRDRVDALRLEGIRVLYEARKVFRAACGREGSRNGEKHDLLAFEYFVGGRLLWSLRSRHH